MLEIIRIGLHRVAMMQHGPESRDGNDPRPLHTNYIFRNTAAGRNIFWHERYALTIWTSVASSCLGRMPANN